MQAKRTNYKGNPLKIDLDHILTNTEGLWEELRGQRMFITGGTGFFGCWLLESFIWANDRLKLNAEAHVLARNPSVLQKKAPHLAMYPSIYLHTGDVRSFAFPEGEFSHIIHAATEASASLNNDNPLLMLDTIIDGTRRTLEFARCCGAQKFLLISSGAVYGKQPPDITHITEDYIGTPDTQDPHSAYGEGKRLAELLCAIHSKQYGIETKIARCFAFVGPYLPLDTHFAIGNFIRDGLNRGPILVSGDGTPYRSYLYAADLAIWLWTILFKGESCRPYNVGSDESISILELAKKVISFIDTSIEIRVMSKPNMKSTPTRYVPDITRVMSELGINNFTDIDKAIKRTLSWMK